jgi:hypothetical protein
MSTTRDLVAIGSYQLATKGAAAIPQLFGYRTRQLPVALGERTPLSHDIYFRSRSFVTPKNINRARVKSGNKKRSQ